MGLLYVNMLVLYGEGKTAFCHLQLEIIHASNGHPTVVALAHSSEPAAVVEGVHQFGFVGIQLLQVFCCCTISPRGTCSGSWRIL